LGRPLRLPGDLGVSLLPVLDGQPELFDRRFVLLELGAIRFCLGEGEAGVFGRPLGIPSGLGQLTLKILGPASDSR
jgi:hypothetical protein